jgi:hypothetical protein
MYAAIIGRKLGGLRLKVWQAAVMRSGLLTTIVLALLLAGAVL